MEILRPAIKSKVASEIEWVTKKEDSYAKAAFWEEIKAEIFRGRKWGSQSGFELYAGVFIGYISHQIVNQHFDELAEKILTPPNSIGDYWLKKQVSHIVYGVETELKTHWKI
jgi:hypothetical protein